MTKDMKSLSDLEVLQSTSDGLSLKGILLENDFYSSGRESVICLPSVITLRSPILQKSIQQNEFHSKKLRNTFIKSLQNGEYSFTQCYDRLTDKLDLGTENYWNKHYFGVVRYCFVPVASFTFDVDGLTLTDRCINTLTNLEEKFQILSEDDMQELCDHFFKSFGSHINIGPIHFGGIFLWKSDYHSMTKYENKMIREVSEKALDAFKGPSSKIKIPDLTERMSLEIDHIGGRHTLNSLEVWEKYLKLERSNWRLIDRGSEKNFVRIWNLLKNHRQSFRNLSEFRIYLDNAWEKHKENKLILDIRTYCNDNMFAKNCKIYLQIIANSRMDPGRITEWTAIVVKPEIIDLMMAIFRNKDDLDAGDVYDIKTLLFELLGGTEDISFDGKEDLLRWINPAAAIHYHSVKPTYTIVSFIDEIKRFLVPKVKEIESCSHEEISRKEMECKYDFASRVKRAITILSNHNRCNDASFLKLMLFELGYDLEFDTFPYCERLSLESVQALIDHISFENRRFNKLKKTDAETINFYLLGIALKAAEKRETDKKTMESKFKNVISQINLEAGSRGVIESYTKELLTWDKIRYIINTFNNSNKRILKEDGEDDKASEDRDCSFEAQIPEKENMVEGPYQAVNKYLPLTHKLMQKPCEVELKSPTVATNQVWNEPSHEVQSQSVDDKPKVSIAKSHAEDKCSFKESYEKQVITWGKLTSAIEARINADENSTNITEDGNLGVFEICENVYNNKPEEIDLDEVMEDTQCIPSLNQGNSAEPESRNDDLCDTGIFEEVQCAPPVSADNLYQPSDNDNSWCINEAYQGTKDETDVSNDNTDIPTDTDQPLSHSEGIKGDQNMQDETNSDDFTNESDDRQTTGIPLKYNNRIYLPGPIRQVEKRLSFNQDRGSAKHNRFAYRKSKLRKTKSASDLCMPDYLLDDSKYSLLEAHAHSHARSQTVSHEHSEYGKVSLFKEMFEKWQSVPDLNDSSHLLCSNQQQSTSCSSYSDFIEIEKNAVARRRRELSLNPVFNKLRERRKAFRLPIPGKIAVPTALSTPDLSDSTQVVDGGNSSLSAEKTEETEIKSGNTKKVMSRSTSVPVGDNRKEKETLLSNVDKLIQEIKSLPNHKRYKHLGMSQSNERHERSNKTQDDSSSSQTKEKSKDEPPASYSSYRKNTAGEGSRWSKTLAEENSIQSTAKNIPTRIDILKLEGYTQSADLLEEMKKTSKYIEPLGEKERTSPVDLIHPDKNVADIIDSTTGKRCTDRQNTYTLESSQTISEHELKLFEPSMVQATVNDNSNSSTCQESHKGKSSLEYNSEEISVDNTILDTVKSTIEKKITPELNLREKTEQISNLSTETRSNVRTSSLDLHPTMPGSRVRLSIESRRCLRQSSLDLEIKAEETYTSKVQILDRLGLISYFPSKITLSDVRRCFKNTVDDLYDVPWFFLSKILMLDYNGRNMLQFPQHSNRQNTKDVENDLDSLFEIPMLADKGVNPMDVVVAVILCSDYFLRQLLAQKLYMCRLSIPLLLPKLTDEYELQIWPLRGIALGAECENDSALSYPTPIVSFLRFGDLPQSKSKLLNDILSDQSTDTFFHKDCGNGSEKKILSYGLIDAAWFIPSPSLKCICKVADACKCHINQLVMFLNLHGNCKDLDTPRKFICKVSNVVTVLIDVRKLKNKMILDCFKQTVDDARKVLLILTNEKHLSTEYFKENYGNLLLLLGRNKEKVKPLLTFNQYGKPINLQKLKENIKSVINQLLSEKYIVAKTLSDQFKYIYIPKIKVDEDDPVSKSAHSEAYTIYAMMNNANLVQTKERFLPLQGELWKQWGELERDMKRGQPSQNQSYEHYVSNVHMQQMDIRDQQVTKYWESNRVMQMICANLKRLKGNNRRFYIHWLRYYLDELARRHLPQIRQKLQKKWSDLTALQQKGPETNYKSEYEILKSDIRELEKSLERASLGLEHIFREVGQIYESFSISSKADTVARRRFESLPLVMAELLLQGYTVEIMDGNARQVPMTFIKAVFSQLDGLIKGNVFVLSVLGLQSSGKSTLLNAMFGVQFSTSAGRCTQGVNAQLVSMPANIVERYGYEYIMLIDTEGLRSADLGDENRQRDNELATLAVGLGDLSIINVKGENQTELNDVLQIVVHALLKIKMVNKRLRLQSSCFFVHQNVGAIDAEAKLLDEQMKLAHKLDAIAVAAAAQTGHHDITSFSKIIEFDVQRDIRYFCDLWQGNPPMAPTNPGYSKKVRDVKTTLLETIIPRKDTKTNMTTLTSRLEDLWSGILDEDFVFSFKNSQEIKAYTTLETEYNNIKWELKEKGLIWLNDIKLNMKGSSSNEFSISEFQLELEEMMEKAYEDFAKSLATFCKKSNERTILEQWRANYQLKLKNLKDETVSEIIKMLKDDIQIRKRQIENDKRSIAWREAFRKKAIDLAKSESSSDVKLSSNQMKTVFEGLWEESLKELPSCTFDGEENVELIVTNYLKLAARPNHQVFQHYYDCLKAGSLDISNYFQPMEKYIMKCDGLVKQIWRSLFNEYTEKVDEITQRIFKRVTNYTANIKQKNFSKAHVEKVVEIVTKEIEEWNQSGKMFELTAWYKVEILVKIGEQIKPTFITLQENFRKKVDPRSQLESFKLLLLTQFMDTFEKIKQEKTIAKLVSQVVENAIKEKMNIDLPRDLANDVRTNNAFMLSKKELLTKVLTDLADEDEFLEFMKFVDNTNEFLRGRLRRYTNDYLFNTDKKFSSLAIIRCETIFANVAKNLQSMRNVLEQPNVDPNIEEWIQSFTIAMKNTIPVTKEIMKDIIKDSIKGEFDIKIYDEFLMERFSKIKDHLKVVYTNVCSLDESIEQQVIEQLAGSVLGCSKQCPFCRVSCTLTINDHDVDCSSPQHYPKGVAGYHWTMNKKLAIDTCTTAVASDLTFRNIDTKYRSVPFKDYKKYYTTWKIQGDKSLDASLYWKWFMAKYINKLAEYYKHEVPDIPEAWHVSKEAAQRSLITQI